MAAGVLVGADLEMARVGPACEGRRLEQPRVGLAHRPRPRQRAEVGGPLLAPALADPPRDPAEQQRATSTAAIAATSSSTACPFQRGHRPPTASAPPAIAAWADGRRSEVTTPHAGVTRPRRNATVDA